MQYQPALHKLHKFAQVAAKSVHKLGATLHKLILRLAQVFARIDSPAIPRPDAIEVVVLCGTLDVA